MEDVGTEENIDINLDVAVSPRPFGGGVNMWLGTNSGPLIHEYMEGGMFGLYK